MEEREEERSDDLRDFYQVVLLEIHNHQPHFIAFPFFFPLIRTSAQRTRSWYIVRKNGWFLIAILISCRHARSSISITEINNSTHIKIVLSFHWTDITRKISPLIKNEKNLSALRLKWSSLFSWYFWSSALCNKVSLRRNTSRYSREYHSHDIFNVVLSLIISDGVYVAFHYRTFIL